MKKNKTNIIIAILVIAIIVLLCVVAFKDKIGKGSEVIKTDFSSQDKTDTATKNDDSSEKVLGYSPAQWEDMVRRYETDHMGYVADKIEAKKSSSGNLIIQTYVTGEDGALKEDLSFTVDEEEYLEYDNYGKKYDLIGNKEIFGYNNYLTLDFREGKLIKIGETITKSYEYYAERFDLGAPNKEYLYIPTIDLQTDGYTEYDYGFIIIPKDNSIDINPVVGYYDEDGKFVEKMAEKRHFDMPFYVEVSPPYMGGRLFLNIKIQGREYFVPVIYNNGKFDFSGFNFIEEMR